MTKAQPQAKPQAQDKTDVLSYYDMDTVLKIAAESKKQIAKGQYYTPDQVDAQIELLRQALRNTR